MIVSETFWHFLRVSDTRFSFACRRIAAPATALIHTTALITIFQTEYGCFAIALALLTWAFLNSFLLVVLRRPATSAALSLMIVGALIALSQFKFSVLEMTISFLDFDRRCRYSPLPTYDLSQSVQDDYRSHRSRRAAHNPALAN
jgi:hypothetical protein